MRFDNLDKVLGAVFLAGVGMVTTVAIVSCADDGVAVERTTNQNVPVTLLLEHDGYRVFRFYDAGKYHYFVVPEGVVDYGWSESRGKSSVEERGEIQTERGGR